MKELIGRIVIDEDGSECQVMDATSNSINIFIQAKNKEGISASNWFTDKDFKNRFKLKETL